uniref:Uncharacterized protein n=1 Tax=Onchocerca volvulus TaxID=6282 RepID=A0A8R1XU31_ONCVO
MPFWTPYGLCYTNDLNGSDRSKGDTIVNSYCSPFPFLLGEVDVPQLATGQPEANHQPHSEPS